MFQLSKAAIVLRLQGERMRRKPHDCVDCGEDIRGLWANATYCRECSLNHEGLNKEIANAKRVLQNWMLKTFKRKRV